MFSCIGVVKISAHYINCQPFKWHSFFYTTQSQADISIRSSKKGQYSPNLCQIYIQICTQVAQASIQLKDLCIAVRGAGKLTVQQLKQDKNCTWLLMSLPLSTCIYQAESVIGSLNCELINVGDSVQFITGENEVPVNFVLFVAHPHHFPPGFLEIAVSVTNIVTAVCT